MSNEKRTMTYIGKIDLLEKAYRKLLVGETLSYEEKSLLLATAICLLKEYDLDKTKKMFFELSYEIIVRYSIFTGDYKPLYDFSINYGFFPIVDYILEHNEEFSQSVTDVINKIHIDKYRMEKFMPTIQQHNAYEGVLKDENNDISFVAPTSFGKSELIVRHIKKVNTPSLKAAIIVPTKSLLMQTYKYVKEQLTDKRIILHDQMYTSEQSYIAVLTQERALRLLEKHNTYFDYLYIDEAHNLFDKDMRNRLLARLIRLSRMKNTHCEILYFSPLVEASDNLKVLGTTSISEYRIDHNIKIPTYFLYQNKKSYVYNRYFNKHYDLFNEYGSPYLYILNKATDKNLLYINAPRRMESVTLKFAKQLQLSDIDSPMIQQIVSSVKKHVHNDFQMIPLIQKGVVYLHGKLPDYVKDYIEYKAATTPEIKYISANSVLLEGINLPITSLFILDARGLKTNKLVNLSGRVNRLNSIFGTHANIKKLLPPIHFVSNDDFSASMKTYIERLRTNDIVDNIENPFLENFDENTVAPEKKEQIEKTKSEEEIYFSDINTPDGLLYQKMIALALNSHLSLNATTICEILSRIQNFKNNREFSDKGIVQKVVNVFLDDIAVIDHEIARLRNKYAIDYYENYLSVMRRRSLQQNIRYELEYFKTRKISRDPYMFMGSSYGEVYRPEDEERKLLYVDLRQKNETEMLNLAIIKLKIEDDFLSYKFNKFVELLHEYELITDEEYNFTTYGTEDEFEIKLVKQVLPIHLVSKLTRDQQLSNLHFDENNIVHCNSSFHTYYELLDDFYQYQINKYIYV